MTTFLTGFLEAFEDFAAGPTSLAVVHQQQEYQ
jgi:hypothetical protein